MSFIFTYSIAFATITLHFQIDAIYVLCSDQEIRLQNPYKTTGKVITLCILTFWVSESEWKM